MSLDVQNLSFGYNGRKILKNIDLHVIPGQLMTILGPNGVGKTTMLKCMGAFLPSSGGTVLLEDQNLLKMRAMEVALRVGYVSQRIETARLSVFDAVLMGRKPHLGCWCVKKKDLKIVNAAVALLGLEDLALRYLDELSGGELQKVALARAMVQEPRVLLLDEPTSALDLKNQLMILSIIRRIVDEHKIAAVMTMHDLNTAFRYGDRFCFLKKGEVFHVSARDNVTPEVIAQVYGVAVSIHQVEGQMIIVPSETTC